MPQLIASVQGVEINHVFLQEDRTTLGRKPHNDIVFDNMVVSGEHCVFELEGLAKVYIQDLASTNGTYINNRMIKSRQLLADGDIITIGNFRVQFLAASEHEHPGARPAAAETTVMPLEAMGLFGSGGALRASLKVTAGASAGQEIKVVKAVTTFGEPGVALVSVSHRRDGYYVARMEGAVAPTLNGSPIGLRAVALAHGDVLKLGKVEMEFLLKA